MRTAFGCGLSFGGMASFYWIVIANHMLNFILFSHAIAYTCQFSILQIQQFVLTKTDRSTDGRFMWSI